jgi:hypothetical protein
MPSRVEKGASVTSVSESERIIGLPEWITPTLHRKRGRDPLGLETITTDRIIPRLVPGILALSRRARYLSYYAFLLDEYRRHRLVPSNQALSTFIKAREYDYALAVQLCPQGCGSLPSGVVGKQRAGPASRRATALLERGESVESYLGGYGLYYRTPLTDLGIVAPAGAPLGDDVTPVDVLVKDERAALLAGTFRSAIAHTRYFQDHMYGVEPIPLAVLEELADHACLCRLPAYPDEQEALRRALFEPSPHQSERDVEQRRRSFAFFLSLLDADPSITTRDSAFRTAIWHAFEQRTVVTGARAITTAEWAALVAKEYMQDALSVMWMDFCRFGLAHQPADGFGAAALDQAVRGDLVGTGSLDLAGQSVFYHGAMPACAFVAATTTAGARLSLEEIREWALGTGTALAGLAALCVLFSRLPRPEAVPAQWSHIGWRQSNHQLGLLGLHHHIARLLEASPSLADLVLWLIRHCIVSAHESIAYSKLPEFTFRFRWEKGCLRFFDLDDERFGLADIRRDALTWLTADIGFWATVQDRPQLTALGRQFVMRVFA